MTAPPITAPRHRTSLGARFLLTAVGLILAAAGGFATYGLWRAYHLACEPDSWPQTACVIRASTVEMRDVMNHPTQFVPVVTYSYLFDQVSYESTQIRRIPGQTFKHRKQAEEIVAKYPPGQATVCYVNPAEPKTAVLQRESHGSIYSIWFPLIFVVGGLGMVINIWWPEPRDEIEPGDDK